MWNRAGGYFMSETSDLVTVEVKMERKALNKLTHMTGTGNYSDALYEAAESMASKYISKTDPDGDHPFVIESISHDENDSLGEHIDINNFIK